MSREIHNLQGRPDIPPELSRAVRDISERLTKLELQSGVRSRLDASGASGLFAGAVHHMSHEAGGVDEITGDLNANARVDVLVGGVSVGTRRGVNFDADQAVGVDSAGSERVNLTLRLGKSTSITISGNHTLTSAQYQCSIIILSGSPGAGFDLIFPQSANAWVVVNNTSQTVTCKKSGGAGVTIPSNKSGLAVYDGSDIKGGSLN